MKCKNCGFEFDEGIFCPECGTKYEEDIVEEAIEEVVEEAPAIPVEEAEAMAEEAQAEEQPQEETPAVVEELPEVEPPAENVESVTEETSEEYAPIVLVPSEPNPPEETVEPVAEVEETAPSANALAPVVEEVPATVEAHSVETVIEKHIKSPENLEKGKYYLQIAALGNKDNLNNIIQKYGTKYPVVLVPLASGKGYQVLIGPLTADEFGMITERFKAYGFKDCFLKKIK